MGQDSKQGDLRGGKMNTDLKLEIRDSKNDMSEKERLSIIEEIELQNV